MLLETCRILIEQHGGQVPRTREALEALPASAQDGERGAQRRVRRSRRWRSTRTFFGSATEPASHRAATPLEVEMKLLKRVLFGVSRRRSPLADPARPLLCLARRPLCERCAVTRWCDSARAS
jgi:endonuclease-3